MWISNVAGALPIVEFAASQLLSTGSPAPTITVTAAAVRPVGHGVQPSCVSAPDQTLADPLTQDHLVRQPRDPYPTDRAVSFIPRGARNLDGTAGGTLPSDPPAVHPP